MQKIIINKINLFGFSFTDDFGKKYSQRKVYRLKLNAELPSKTIEIKLKFAIMRINKCGNKISDYWAMYRHLTDDQIAALKQIMLHFSDDISDYDGEINAEICRKSWR